MKFVLAIILFVAVAVAFEAPKEFHFPESEQVHNPFHWPGTWTARNRYGGVMYTCTKADRLYGVYSNAGFLVGTIFPNRTVEGNWFEGGRGDRNDYQGTFRIKMSDDNQEFDGFFNRVSDGGFKETEHRWHETRLSAPYPMNPTAEDCLMPDDTVDTFVGSWYRSDEYGALQGNYDICRDEWDQVYGSFYQPEGYITGWSVADSSAFHGYRYDSNGNSGAYIMKSLTQNRMKGFYWRGRVAYQNVETSQPEAIIRKTFSVQLSKCENVGPGFNERLKGPRLENVDGNSASTMIASLFVILGAILLAF